MYISQDPIGLKGNNPTLYSYVNDVNSWVDIVGLNPLLSAQEKINAILLDHLPEIQKIDPNVTIGYRGSAASGVSSAHLGDAAKTIDFKNFDVDAFIQSDYLANDPIFTNRRRDADKIPGLGKIQESIDEQLREAFPNNSFKDEPFGFRIFKTHELDDLARKGDVQIKIKCP